MLSTGMTRPVKMNKPELRALAKRLKADLDKRKPPGLIRMTAQSPKGGVTLEGTFFKGGEFIPGRSQEEVDKAAKAGGKPKVKFTERSGELRVPKKASKSVTSTGKSLVESAVSMLKRPTMHITNQGQAEFKAGDLYANSEKARKEFKNRKVFSKAVGDAWVDQTIIDALSSGKMELREIGDVTGIKEGRGGDPLKSELNKSLVRLRDSGKIKASQGQFGDPVFELIRSS